VEMRDARGGIYLIILD